MSQLQQVLGGDVDGGEVEQDPAQLQDILRIVGHFGGLSHQLDRRRSGVGNPSQEPDGVTPMREVAMSSMIAGCNEVDGVGGVLVAQSEQSPVPRGSLAMSATRRAANGPVPRTCAVRSCAGVSRSDAGP